LFGVNRNSILGSNDLARITHLARKRLKQMPIQYVLEEWDFRDLTIQLRPPVFIPRPETEVGGQSHVFSGSIEIC